MLTLDPIIWHTTSSELDAKSIGGKALGLYKLQKLSMNVPIWAAISTSFFEELIKSHPSLQKQILEENAKEIRKYIRKMTFSSSEESLLKDVWKVISQEGCKSVAVRSSAVDEDGSNLSFAGQMDSFLQICSYSDYLQAIKDCFASLFGDRAIAYRLRNNIDPWQAKMAVVVQQMVDAEVSGVMFTANPINGNVEEMLVTSVCGLGEALVSGKVDADTYTLDKKGNILEKQIIFDSMQVGELKELAELALIAEKNQKLPLDIEFAIDQGKIYLLQARPITSIIPKDHVRIWDNSNIVESYSGVTTPLTFSFIRNAYYAVYCQFCETLGISKQTIFKNRGVLSNMLGLIQGRVYYNLLNWYRLISLMPGFEYNKEFMEQMMGIQVIEKEPLKKEKKKFQKYFRELPKLIKVLIKMIIAHYRLPKKIDEFHAHFRKIYDQYSKVDYEKKTPTEILSIYRTLEEEILWKWRSPITNDFEAMIFYGLLKKLTLKWKVDPDGILQNDLLSGEGDIKSTELITSLIHLTREIEKDPKLKGCVLDVSPEKAFAILKTSKTFHQKFEKYLEIYGVRCIHEMKLESTPIQDDPLFCIATIQNYLRNSSLNAKEQRPGENQIRQKAEKLLKSKLKGLKRWIYCWVLKNARRAIKNRENQRFARTEAYSLVRRLVRSIAKKWQKKGIIDSERDIFYLELEEIWSYIEGTSTCVHLKELIQLRKEEFKAYEEQSPDDRIETEGEVYFANLFEKKEPSLSSDVIQGLGCCSGVVESSVQVVLTPDKDLKLQNEIMIAKETDPGWGILFPSISGLIVEKGSMLSHSAIVAREMGIPAVIGVKNATKIFRSGDRVRLDGSTGIIEVL